MPSTIGPSVRVFTIAALLMMLAAAFMVLTASVPADTKSLETLLAYLKSPNISTRRDAAHKLGERRVRNQLAIEALATTVAKDDSADVREEAVNSLGLIKDFSALPEMLGAIKDIKPDVRSVAARSLVALYTEHDIDFITNRRSGWNLFNPLLDTSDHEIIEPYILVDPRIVDALGEAARGDRERDVRISAIRSLGVLRGSGAIAHLAEALTADQDVRIEVLRAFIKIGDPTAGPHLVQFFSDSDQKVRTQAMVAAGMLKYRPAVEPLIAIYRLGPEKKGSIKLVTDTVKGRFTYLPPRDEAALWALSLLGDERAEQVFAENITNKDGDRRQRATEGLARLAKPQYLDQISQLINKEKNGDVKLAQHWALYRMGSNPHLTYIVRKLDTDRAGQARGYLLESNPADLYVHIHSSTKSIRQGVIEVLGRIGDAETVKELEPAVRASSAETADTATLAIKRIEWRMAGRPRASDDVLQRTRPASNP
ncbi:MAG TPA: HEAT repeat domain-containing protein [Blastocatellia bacterium]|nr:HEAT repeat domain-containing protein [Blastocatellia bacterium]